MFVSEARGQWSGSPRGREHFARLGLTCVALPHPGTVLTYGDILECICGDVCVGVVDGKTGWMEDSGHQMRDASWDEHSTDSNSHAQTCCPSLLSS